MSYLDMITFEESSLLEGEQMKKYVQQKRDAKDAQNAKDRKDQNRYYDSNTGKFGNRSDVATNYAPTTANNPAHDKGREFAALRNGNEDIFPKKLSKSEKALNKSENREDNARRYASETLSNASATHRSLRNGKNYEYQTAHDAARRHYRRTHKEAAELVELAESMLEAYNPDCVFC